MILRSLVKSSDRNSDGGMDWEELEGFGDFELVFLRWQERFILYIIFKFLPKLDISLF